MQMADAESLPYCVPKRTPKWVVGFADWLEERGLDDPAIAQMRETWKRYHESHWDAFNQCGKKRKAREKAAGEGDGERDHADDGDTSEGGSVKVPRVVRTKMRKHTLRVKELTNKYKDDVALCDEVNKLRAYVERYL